jgi:tripartite motif-containing protein 23
LRDQLTRQEVAALTVVDTYVRERLCFIRQHEEDIDLMLNQVNIVCNHISKAIRQDDARVILAASEIRQMIETVEAQQKQFAEINNEQLLPDASIPITFTKGRKTISHFKPLQLSFLNRNISRNIFYFIGLLQLMLYLT